jgi:hypothetical protein
MCTTVKPDLDRGRNIELSRNRSWCSIARCGEALRQACAASLRGFKQVLLIRAFRRKRHGSTGTAITLKRCSVAAWYGWEVENSWECLNCSLRRRTVFDRISGLGCAFFWICVNRIWTVDGCILLYYIIFRFVVSAQLCSRGWWTAEFTREKLQTCVILSFSTSGIFRSQLRLRLNCANISQIPADHYFKFFSNS